MVLMFFKTLKCDLYCTPFLYGSSRMCGEQSRPFSFFFASCG